MQLVDDRKAAVVEDKDDQFLARQNGRIDVGIQQKVAAVTDEDDGVAVGFLFGLCNSRAPAARDFIAHAGKAEFDIHRADAKGAPVGGHLGGQAACGGDDPVAGMAKGVHHADGLRVGVGAVAVGHVGGDIGVPCLAFGLGLCRPVVSGAVALQGGTKGQKTQFRIAHHGQRLVFGGIVATGVQADQAGILGKDRPGAGREILQPRAHGQHHIRRPSDGVGAV